MSKYLSCPFWEMLYANSYLRVSTSQLSQFKLPSSPVMQMGLKSLLISLAGVAQWTECQPVNQRVAGSIPRQGTCLGCGPGPQWRAHERQPHIAVSLPLFLVAFPSL